MNITQDSAVQMHYHLTLDNGVVVDSSKGGEPLAYLHGHGNLVAGVEKSLEGKVAGDSLSVVVPPKEGYGLRDPRLDVAIPLQSLPEALRRELAEGLRFRGPHPVNSDQVTTYLVIKLEEDQVLCTANHPLAGETLHFDIEVVEVRQGTGGEIADGRIHSPECSTGCC